VDELDDYDITMPDGVSAACNQNVDEKDESDSIEE